ncbi:hypothetical protein KFK09_014378 [Dendrobium nobile]|uniref:Uncharacterized protein n=1 Tax=Dendrobium nobile TaxID=94219 RepID=A0A8T3B1X1_DENNO|nr:hypothetical protein KFK09_014378 [Dendrobium nobile]
MVLRLRADLPIAIRNNLVPFYSDIVAELNGINSEIENILFDHVNDELDSIIAALRRHLQNNKDILLPQQIRTIGERVLLEMDNFMPRYAQ